MPTPASIICADDEQSMHLIYKAILKERDYDVRFCVTGAEVLAAVDEAPADLVILDVGMPEMNGIEACRELRQREDTYDLPIIIVSASDSEETIEEGLGSGADEYLIKPIKEPELLAKVAVTLERRRRTAPDEAPVLRVGDLFAGRYLIMGRLGAGGFSTVYDAEYTVQEPALRVALKIFDLPPSKAGDRQFMSLFLREAFEHSRLDHPNIAKLYDFGQAAGQYFLAMEYLAGESLAEVIEKHGALAEKYLAFIGYEMARALRYMEDPQVVHRDISPANIMITGAGDVKLLDFGMAKRRRDHTLSLEDEIRCTPECVSPEYILGREDIDGRSDLFSLGAVLFIAATNHMPVYGETALEMLQNKLEDIPPLVQQLNPAYSSDFSDLIAAMLQKDPDDRPPIRDVLAVLRDLVVSDE